MSALERLSEEEAALYAILTDPSGSELAEFMYVDDMSEGGRYRLWDFQWEYNHCDEKYQADAMGRGLGKSVSATLRACAFPFNFPGQEILITAPEGSHLNLVTNKVQANLERYRLFDGMLKKDKKSSGIKGTPQFEVTYANGTHILSRLPGRTGAGVKGPHPLAIELDELQDYHPQGYIELLETIKISEPGAIWRAHGVSKGMGDLHYQVTSGKDPNIPWYVHKYIAAHRPTWNDKERKEKIALYGGSEEAPDYIRNIFGEPGSNSNPVFVMARLLASVRVRESAWAEIYNDQIYRHIVIKDPQRKRALQQGIEIGDMIDIPESHLEEQYVSFWVGMDVGFTTDPTEILVMGVVRRPGKSDLHRLLLRVSLQHIGFDHQAEVVARVFELYGERLRRWGMDKTGNGLPVWQHLAGRADIGRRIAGYGFSEKKSVAFDDRDLKPGEKPEDATIKKSVIDFATDVLRAWVDTGSVELPYDQELVGQWGAQGMVERRAGRSGESAVRSYVGGADHTLDAARMLAAAKELDMIDQLLESTVPQTPVLDLF